ncbi:MAG: methyltransferase domain-containing protein [Candidatus Hydrogenedentota bacterium]
METRNETGLDNLDLYNRAFFDSVAHEWDAHMGPEHPEKLAGIVETLALRPGESVLDVGTGAGVLLPLAAPCVAPTGVVIAVDLAFRMVQEARLRHGSLENLRFVQANALRLPFGHAVFDRIVCNSVFPHFADQAATVRQLAGLLKPGGECAVCHTESRDDINAFHCSLGGVLAESELPAESVMQRLFTAAGLEITALEDGPERYLLRARKPRS